VTGGPAIETLEDFLAHALAIEEEAEARYRELAEQMTVHNNPEVARLFARMAQAEGEHARRLRENARTLVLPRIARGAYAWGAAESPETASFEDMHYRMTAYHALQVALANERRAQAFFERVAASAPQPLVRQLAQEAARDEARHVIAVSTALERTPAPPEDWSSDDDPPNEPE
jgi:rubrerythrin